MEEWEIGIRGLSEPQITRITQIARIREDLELEFPPTEKDKREGWKIRRGRKGGMEDWKDGRVGNRNPPIV